MRKENFELLEGRFGSGAADTVAQCGTSAVAEEAEEEGKETLFTTISKNVQHHKMEDEHSRCSVTAEKKNDHTQPLVLCEVM